MKVTLLTTVNSRSAGGLFYSVKYLAKYLKKNSVDISITSFNDKFSTEDIKTYDDTTLHIYNLWGNFLTKKLGFSRDLEVTLENLNPDIIHQQGIWMYHSNANLNYQKKHISSKSIIAPRGMLDPWLTKNSKFVKKIIAHFYENSNLNKADCLHALCLSEMESMRKYGLKNPIAVIPNGIELTDWKKEYTLNKNEKKILYLGRLDPKKGVDVFINAIGLINNESVSLLSGWKIIIAGWGNKSYINQLKGIISKYNLESIIELQGAKYGVEKIDLLKDVDAFILPSYSEGLPMAILEAWSYQLPVVMTKFCNLPEGFNKKAAFEISTDLDEQKKQLMKFFLLSNEELILLGNNGRKLVEDTFSWNKISRQTEILYNWLLSDKKEKPDFIYYYDQI